ncbi:hypothetical protein KIPB_008400 [Kipferlia bialata]|uniref:Uncharacterized protein n=1 Tax=Kipferlia bialata TaxID=797122 RepID=A0A9K3D2B5_9EUKA|nr:hypothetical protein KIPB_008400 [Kipferlia bialata]|eukprot:g8400.t1
MSDSSLSLATFSEDVTRAVCGIIASIEQFDTDLVDMALENIDRLIPVGSRLSDQLKELRLLLEDYPTDKLPAVDCTSLLKRLTDGLFLLETDITSLASFDFNPLEALATLQDTSALLAAIAGAHTVSVPQDSQGLGLAQMVTYHLMLTHNAKVHELFVMAGKVIAYQDSIIEYTATLSGVETPDIEESRKVAEECHSLLRVLKVLAPKQTAALKLVEEYCLLPVVTREEIEETEYESEVKKLESRNPKTSADAKRAATNTHSQLQRKVCELKRFAATRERLAAQMQAYLVFPEVADALGVEVVPFEEGVKEGVPQALPGPDTLLTLENTL